MYTLNSRLTALAAIASLVLVNMVACDAGSDDTSGSESSTTGSGSGGSQASGSGGATATSTGTGGTMIITPADLIDDLEDGDPLILAKDGRVGAWYVYNDESDGAVQTPDITMPFLPEMGGPGNSLNYALTTGSGFADWGAGFGFDLNNPGDGMGGPGIKSIWDASAYQGVVFWARGNVPSVRVKLLTDPIVSEEEGGVCQISCNDAHGSIVALSQEWQQHSILWSELAQEGWGTQASFDASLLMGIQFQISAGQDFEVAIDEIGFF